MPMPALSPAVSVFGVCAKLGVAVTVVVAVRVAVLATVAVQVVGFGATLLINCHCIELSLFRK
jgi:hypothetical protein